MLTRFTERSYRLAAHIVLGLVAALVLLTFRHYGVSWDEEIQSQYGQAVYDYYVSGFVDRRYAEIFNLHLYGGMFDGLAAFLNSYTPVNVYETRHLLNGLFGVLGLWGTWRLGRLFGGGLVGLVALVFLALTPMYYGHIFNNPKDIPFAVGVVWSLYYMSRALMIYPQIRRKLILKLGFVLGLTLGIRVGGVMIAGYWGLVAAVLAIALARPLSVARARDVAFGLVRLGLPVLLIAYAVMLVCWPWAHESPLLNPIKAFVQFSDFPQVVEVMLNGATMMSTELPWHYVPTYFFVQLPLFQLVMILAGIILLPHIFRHAPSPGHKAALCLAILTIAVPLLYAMLRRPALYDAVRHFIFILPVLCIIGALVTREVLLWAKARTVRVGQGFRRRLVRGLFLAVMFALLVQPAVSMIRLHPYEYIYVNELEGGVQGAFGHYELDYWGSSFKEAAEKLQAVVATEGGVPAGTIYKVAICGPWAAATIYLPPDYEAVVANEPADFFLATTRWMCQDMREGKKEIVRVERQGVPLAVVKDLRGTEEGRLGLPNYRDELRKEEEEERQKEKAVPAE